MLKGFVANKNGQVSLEDYQTALDEILYLRKRIRILEAAQSEQTICTCPVCGGKNGCHVDKEVEISITPHYPKNCTCEPDYDYFEIDPKCPVHGCAPA